MMNFANVAAVTIPQGSVRRISQSGVTLWEKDAGGKYTFTVTATNAAGSDSKQLSITIAEAA